MNQNRENRESVCHSTFKNGNDTTKDRFTEKWIELINMLEKSKSVCASA